ncbi:hypothetical protein C162_07249 [Paenibacillus sp. FSL R7-269]|uniref:hypothetical protein n=1 Tax=Paenibacillus sp. FSL R7-269 TaxID=1226755 RepID=UPI0003E257A5|nr:hypothetical protein [Paenibacillus sp. FSL R7-269]ETT53532.1 hypothetical protein C162_07249 [Paenibacillus sp. FSL R7-269]
MKALQTILQAILYVLLVIGLHLILIYYLEIKMERWGTALLEETIRVYIIPLILCSVNAIIISRNRRIKYKINWFLVTMLSSLLLLLFFIAVQNDGDSDEGRIVSFQFFPKYQLEMLFILPWSIAIIQFILTLYYLFKMRKEKMGGLYDNEQG